MADDEFDIDIYGDTAQESDETFKKDDEGDVKIEGVESTPADTTTDTNGNNDMNYKQEDDDNYLDTSAGQEDHKMDGQQQIKSTDESGQESLAIPKHAPQQQGVKRKEGSDDRPLDPGATTSILISELHWWNTDDDVRGWINQAQVEDEMKDITFSEHKVNGKSKGQAYVEFTSQQAATAAKHKLEAFGEGQQYVKKLVVTYSNPNNNPFKTLPKDAPPKAARDGPNNSARGNYNDRGSHNGNYRGNFQPRAGGYSQGRGGMNQNNNNFNQNRNFSGPAMGGNMGGFNPAMGGFQNPMAGGFRGGFNQGGMMQNGMRGGMRGGRGGMNGMNGGMMGGMPMGGMPMGGMPMNMGGIPGMPGMPGMPGQGFQQPHFNPAFFQQNQPAGGDWQNPHGAKRQRPE